jgi:hypothetical protein
MNEEVQEVKSLKKVIATTVVLTAIFLGLGASLTFTVLENRRDTETKQLTGAYAMNQEQLEGLVKKKNLELYWAGPRPGYLYAVEATEKDRAFLRYIKKDAKPSDVVSNSRIIATYQSKSAFADSVAAAGREGNTGFRNHDGSVVFYATDKNTSIYIAFPKKKIQLEIFDPIPGQALSLAILQDQITKVGQ